MVAEPAAELSFGAAQCSATWLARASPTIHASGEEQFVQVDYNGSLRLDVDAVASYLTTVYKIWVVILKYKTIIRLSKQLLQVQSTHEKVDQFK